MPCFSRRPSRALYEDSQVEWQDVPEKGRDHQQAKQSLKIAVAVAGHDALSIHDH